MNSSIYIGHIEHNRYLPVRHRLRYPIYLYAFDLDDLPVIPKTTPFFGYNRLRPSSIHDTDYLTPGHAPVQQKIRALLSEHGITSPVASVILVTSARYFGYVFNPVSFHYCFSKAKELIAVVAEVNNTYGERHCYVLSENLGPLNGFRASYRAQKAFHVSPFNQIDGWYAFFFSDLTDQLSIRIDLKRDKTTVFDASLKATALPMTPYHHLKTLLRHPVVPHLNIPRIYLEALKLKFKRNLAFHDKPAPESPMTIVRQQPGMIERLCLSGIVSRFRRIDQGCLTLLLPDGRNMTFGEPDSPIQATLDIRDYRFFKRTAWGGEIGFGESYVNGEWESDDLPALFRVIILNRDHLSDGNLAASLITRIVERVAHEARKNTHGNSKKNIASHYDIGNRLYEMFLDAHMIYSCAIFHRDDDSLETAQENKMRAIIEKAGIGNGDHVLEIGCGWGGFAVFAAKETGCRVTGITVSQAQYEVACRRVREEGLLGRVTILLKDYRDIKGTYDTIVSIEMIEAVGKEFLGDFFRVCRKRLKPQGTMVFQSITIPDDRYARYIRERDWIQKHIFPGGHLPCMASLTDVIRKTTNFTIRTVDSIGPHYANTLRQWRQRFDHNWSALSELGFDLSFYRKWIYYFTICEAAFEHGAVDDIHMVLGPPDPDPARR